ncbi:xylose isomerase domain-containing protein TIM barrel [Apiospora marii]|uniref:Xylose isomerase domain-containing protein TIM barrel n=1 Tax=Apiospora marii TaxID=335849 RepID=A0ABR1RZQ5_9PEZI
MHLSAHNWMRPEPLEHSLQRLRQLGYTSIELAGEPAWYPVDETRALLQKYNIRCWGTVTIQYGTRDLTSADAGERRATVQYMKDVVALSAALGGEITTVVPGRVGKTVATAGAEEEWGRVVESLREVAAFAQDQKIRIGIEPLNRFETHFLNRVDQALLLADEVGFGAAQLETKPVDVPAGQLQFIVDHGSAVLSDEYYTQLLKTSAETMRRYI